ncbi:MAG: hypothetical protein J6V68_04760, partial [Clostridia bacterium]|nr:hypothetical protein [Clostridia bacterium]
TAHVSEGNKYHFNTPIVFYGSSITHGCSSSRTGNTYTAILSRALDSDYINLGFGESCKGEAIMAEYIASLKKSVFVCGYDHNALTLEELKENHLPFYKRFRSIDKTTPILFVSSPNVILHGDTKTMYERMKVIEDTYKFALDSGDKKVYFINGRTLYPDDIRYDCSADGIHPNDLGAYMIAKGLYKELTKILNR